MGRSRLVFTAVLGLSALSPLAFAADPQPSWDGLAHVASSKLDAVYLAPGADFRPYTKVMLDPTEVAFRKHWLRDYNNQTLDLSQRISDGDAKKMLNEVRTGFEETFRKVYESGGYQVVTEPGPDVLRVRTAVADLYVTAPDKNSAVRTREFARDAGEATVVLEARDSMSGALLGRAVDRRTAGDTGAHLRNRVTNRSDFASLFERWAKISVNGLTELKARSPAPEASRTAGQ